MTVRNWSTVASDNNDPPPYGSPEGQAPSSVNNVIRQVMADVRDSFEQLPYFDFGHVPTRVDNDTFTVPTDLTATYYINRRVKLVGASTGYATISSSSYSAPDTTVNVVMDSGNVPTSLSTVSVGQELTLSTSIKYDITAAEIAAGVTPVNLYAPSHDVTGGIVYVSRYGTNTTPGTTDMTTAINNAILVAYRSGINSGSIKLNDGETYKTTSAINWLSGVGIVGGPVKYTVIKPTMSSGYALDANITLYNQRIQGVTIDGTNLTGTARALRIVNGNRTTFDQFNINNVTGTTVPAMLINGAGYGLLFLHCQFSNNFKHYEITKNGSGSDFPTNILFDFCIFEGSTSASGAACYEIDCSGVVWRDCTVQANASLYTRFTQRTAAASTADEPRISGGWWEDNGGGQAGSIGWYLSGSASGKMKNPIMENVEFHQSVANKPHYQVWCEYTDGFKLRGCSEGFGAGCEMVHDGGNNINYFVDWRGTVSTCGFKTALDWAYANFNGKGGISINSSLNITPTRTGAGAYTLTFGTAPPVANYIVSCTAEDGSTVGNLLSANGVLSSTASFTLNVSNPTTNAATDGRTICVNVKAVPA